MNASVTRIYRCAYQIWQRYGAHIEIGFGAGKGRENEAEREKKTTNPPPPAKTQVMKLQ